jgi:hypothetical protein
MSNDTFSDRILAVAKEDQRLRFQLDVGSDKDELWAKITRQDAKSTKMIKSIIQEIGWPTISKVGEKASQAAWLLVQHADKDLGFQKECLELMKATIEDVRLSDIAFLTDRIRMSEGQPQLYGTQFIPAADGLTYVPYDIEDANNVDIRRREMGLKTLEENTAQINK